MKLRSCCVLALAILLAFTTASWADEEAIRVVRSTRILDEIVAGGKIPGEVLNEARAVAVIPDVVKVAFIAGGRHGSGVLVVRNANGTWSHPAFVTLTGASVGLQAGAQAMDVVLVFRTEKSVERLYDGRLTIGADVAVAAGPVGRRGEAKTDFKLRAGILSYSRTRGVFAGVSLDGAALAMDDGANAAFYGREKIRAVDIFEGRGTKDSEAVDELKGVLARQR